MHIFSFAAGHVDFNVDIIEVAVEAVGVFGTSNAVLSSNFNDLFGRLYRGIQNLFNGDVDRIGSYVQDELIAEDVTDLTVTQVSQMGFGTIVKQGTIGSHDATEGIIVGAAFCRGGAQVVTPGSRGDASRQLAIGPLHLIEKFLPGRFFGHFFDALLDILVVQIGLFVPRG